MEAGEPGARQRLVIVMIIQSYGSRVRGGEAMSIFDQMHVLTSY